MTEKASCNIKIKPEAHKALRIVAAQESLKLSETIVMLCKEHQERKEV